MTCKQCDHELPIGAKFCPECGAPVIVEPPAPAPQEVQLEQPSPIAAAPAQATNDASPQPAVPPVAPVAVPQSKSPTDVRKKRILWMGIAAAAIVSAAIAIFLIVNGNRYTAASGAFAEGRYEEAAAGFAALGNYSDAKQKLELTRNTMDYQAAERLLYQKNYDTAKAAFLALGSFSDAADRAQECQNRSDYDVASELMAKEDYPSAAQAFTALGSFYDAATKAKVCENLLSYRTAEAFLEQEAFEEAAELYRPLSRENFRDAAKKLLYCQNSIEYALAEEFMSAQKYFDAYQSFVQLGRFSDAEARAAQCVLPFPENGAILYRNPLYERQTCKFTLENRNGLYPVYLKMYAENGDLVVTMFIDAGRRGITRVPPGRYSIHEAYGTRWFGPTDMFGDEGYYQIDVFSEGQYWTFETGYYYSITENASGGDMGYNGIDRKNF